MYTCLQATISDMIFRWVSNKRVHSTQHTAQCTQMKNQIQSSLLIDVQFWCKFCKVYNVYIFKSLVIFRFNNLWNCKIWNNWAKTMIATNHLMRDGIFNYLCRFRSFRANKVLFQIFDIIFGNINRSKFALHFRYYEQMACTKQTSFSCSHSIKHYGKPILAESLRNGGSNT